MVETVVPAPTSISLTASPNPASIGQPVSCTATLHSSSGASFSGSVTFLDSVTPLATVQLASGRAIFTTSQLAVGTHALSVSYPGDTNTLPSLSSTVQEVVLNRDFTLSSDPSTLTLRTGHHTTFSFSAASVGLFAGTLQLRDGILPSHASIRIAKPLMTLAEGSQSMTSIYLDTDDVIGYLTQNQLPPTSRSRAPGFVAAAALPCLLLLCSRRRRRAIPFLLTLLMSALLLVSATGCSGKYPASTAPGSYSIQITATSPDLQTSHTLTIPFTVTE